MEKQIIKLYIKYGLDPIHYNNMTNDLFRLFNVSGSCNHEFVWLKPYEDDDLDRRCEKCGYVELHDH